MPSLSLNWEYAPKPFGVAAGDQMTFKVSQNGATVATATVTAAEVNGEVAGSYVFGSLAAGNYDINLNGSQFRITLAATGAVVNETLQYDDAFDFTVEYLSANVSVALGRVYDFFKLDGTSSINAYGTDFEDDLIGNSGNNVIIGYDGNDILVGSDGNDTLRGGGGDDQLWGGSGNDWLEGGAGNDEIIGDDFGIAGKDTLYGGSGNDRLYGNFGSDKIYGDAGNDTLIGGPGADQMRGGTGNDTYYVDNVDDVVTEASNAGTDLVISTVSYTLGANVENLRLSGTAAIDATGNALANAITGNSAANKINGAAGNDMLKGGAGADKFIFNTALGSSNVDRITDFKVVDDTIDLENAIFKALTHTGTLASSAFHIGTAAADASDRIIYNKTTGALLYDSDGTGSHAAVHFAALAHNLTLTHSDFVVV